MVMNSYQLKPGKHFYFCQLQAGLKLSIMESPAVSGSSVGLLILKGNALVILVTIKGKSNVLQLYYL